MRKIAPVLVCLIVLAMVGCSTDDADGADTGRSDVQSGQDTSSSDDAGPGDTHSGRADTSLDTSETDASQTDVSQMDADQLDVATADVTSQQDAASQPDTSATDNCGSDHPRVGWTAELEAAYHNVGGTATIVDNCTVGITNFTYDGTGIDVRIYGAQDADFANGFAMTDDLVRPTAYDGVRLTAKLPSGHSLDELDALSVWCQDIPVDFGSGAFSAP